MTGDGSMDPRKAIFVWYRWLGHSPGPRAALRRCGSTADVFGVRAFHELAQRLGVHGGTRMRWLAVAAAVVAQVRDGARPGGETFGGTLARFGRGLSDSRFRRLVRVDDPDVLLKTMRGLLRVVGERAAVGRLGTDLLDWASPSGEVQKTWATAFYAGTDNDEEDANGGEPE